MAVASGAEISPAGVTPTLAEARALAAEYNLIPLRETFIDDCETPVSAFLKLRDANPTHPHSFLLESADQGRVGRYSFIGFRPRKVLRWSLGDDGDPYALAAAELGRLRVAPLPDLPPFAGGAVGLFAYDLVRTVEPLGPPKPDPIGLPDLALMLTDALVAFDHLKHTVTVIANVYGDDDLEASYARAVETIAEVRWRLAGSGAALAAASCSRPDGGAARRQHDARAVRGERGAHHRVHLRRRCVPGGSVAALVRAGAGRGVLDLPRAAGGQPEPVHVLPGLRRLRDRRRQPRAADHGRRPARVHASDRRYPAARDERRRRPPDRRGAAGRSQGARRARDAGRPRPQRPRAGVRVRVGRGRELHGGRELQPRDAHRLERGRRAARRRRRARGAALGAARPARCPGRPRCGRCRSSTSSSRSSAAATAARSATRATPAISTRASTSARSWSRTGSRTCRPAAGPSPTPSPSSSTASPRPRLAAVLQAIALAASQPEWP